MRKLLFVAAMVIAVNTTASAQESNTIGKNEIKIDNGIMTPEALWAMGRIGSSEASPDGKSIVYQVGYYSVKANKSHQVLYITDSEGKNHTLLTQSDKNETDPTWINGGKDIAFMCDGQIWAMAPDGTNRRQLSNDKEGIEGFKFSPDGKKVIVIKSIPFHEIIKKNPDDLPEATGRIVTDLMYRHWDHYVESIQHPFVADVTDNGITKGYDMLEGEPFECPLEPFGGIEQLDWSKDSKQIAYTCRKLIGKEYSVSTDADIYLFNIETKSTRNLCKPEGYSRPVTDATHTMKDQKVNEESNLVNNPGYDQNPQFSPDGTHIAWLSMARDGYEADRNRLCILNLTTGEKKYLTEDFDSNVDAFCWSNSEDTPIYFIGVWHGCINLYSATWEGKVTQLTNDWSDIVGISSANRGNKLLVTRQSLSSPNDLFIVSPGKNARKTTMCQLTNENDHIMSQLTLGKVEQRWVKTTDGKDMLTWIVLPSNFDPQKKYPTLLFCEGGPQSPVSQFWSYRWNFQIMAANGYVIVAPNRRGLPGFGSEWNEQVSGDWTGQCMNDYLSAIDDAANNLPYVDKEHLGAVGASFGGFSVYWLAGHHDKRFKCFIAHDGAFNLESMYTDTEENWFSNWEYEDAFWKKEMTDNARKTYENSPHRFVDNWDTPILCIHGEKDYRIVYNQGMGAFNAARMKGIPAELLIYPDENHWVLKPQNGILWQRTFFNWLDRWLKK